MLFRSDFGTGYSSLSYLRTLPLNKIKIDRSFIDAMMIDEVGASIVKVIIDLAAALGLETTAEGVKDRRQIEMLRRLGCDAVQGFFIAKPMPAHDIEALLRSHGDPSPATRGAIAPHFNHAKAIAGTIGL